MHRHRYNNTSGAVLTLQSFSGHSLLEQAKAGKIEVNTERLLTLISQSYRYGCWAFLTNSPTCQGKVAGHLAIHTQGIRRLHITFLSMGKWTFWPIGANQFFADRFFPVRSGGSKGWWLDY